MLALLACNKEDSDLKPSNKDKNWFEITKGEGVVNELAYEIYQKYGIPIYATDSLGSELMGYDANGKEIWRVERIDLSYRPNSNPVKDCKIVLSKDESILLKAMGQIEKYVLPNLPTEVSEYRPTSYMIVDTLYYNFPGSKSWGLYSNYNGVRTVAGGRLQELKNLNSEDEWKWWAIQLLAIRVPVWLNLHCESEVSEFHKLTDQVALGGMSFENPYKLSKNNLSQIDLTKTPTKYGFLRFMAEYNTTIYTFGRTPSRNEDLQEYFSAVYFYGSDEEAFIREYVNRERDMRILRDREMNKQYLIDNELASAPRKLATDPIFPLMVDDKGVVNADPSKNIYKIGYFDYWFKPNPNILTKYRIMLKMVEKYEREFKITRKNY